MSILRKLFRTQCFKGLYAFHLLIPMQRQIKSVLASAIVIVQRDADEKSTSECRSTYSDATPDKVCSRQCYCKRSTDADEKSTSECRSTYSDATPDKVCIRQFYCKRST